jgi:hypothetical protein
MSSAIVTTSATDRPRMISSARWRTSSICWRFSPKVRYRTWYAANRTKSELRKNPRRYSPTARWNELAPRMTVLSTSKKAATRPGCAAAPVAGSVGSGTRPL